MCQPKPKPKNKGVVWGNREIVFSIILTAATSPMCSFLQALHSSVPGDCCSLVALSLTQIPTWKPFSASFSLFPLNAFRKGISPSLHVLFMGIFVLCSCIFTAMPGASGGFCTLVFGCHPPLTSTANGVWGETLRKGSRSSLAGTQFPPLVLQKCHPCHPLGCSMSSSHLRGHSHHCVRA